MDSARKVRHFYLFILACLFVYVFHQFMQHEQVVQSISISTAYTSLLFFAATLSIGPVYIFLYKRNPVSIYLRRDLGIWSAIIALIHTLAGLQVHLQGKFLHYFIYPPENAHNIPVRYDPFGLTNHLGVVCILILVILLFLSNNRSLQKMGKDKWKKWQRSTYFLVAAIPIHGLIYQFLEKRIGLYTVSMLAIVLIILGAQIFGILQYRRNSNG